jgi:hypothetical protein
VRLSRPATWRVRRASTTPERRFIEYVSPSAYLFSVYEKTDSASDSWSDLLGRYESAARDRGAEVVGDRIPVATWNAQGREYLLRRSVHGQRAPYEQQSSEVVLRGGRRVELVQIVHQGDSLAPIRRELLWVMESLRVE